ncbi:MAG: MBL fold metallo-hydrolase, partial [Desulfobacula sp.]|nr:MBL fold metallo-hydrolase [Desulfobacula sp.]
MQNKSLFIKRLNVGPFAVNTYIVACPQTLEGIIIDPGGEDEKIIQTIDNNKIIPKYIINTHGHRDHVYSNLSLSRCCNIPVCMHIDDKLFFQKLKALQDTGVRNNYTVDIELHHDDVIQVGTLKIKVIHTPG